MFLTENKQTLPQLEKHVKKLSKETENKKKKTLQILKVGVDINLKSIWKKNMTDNKKYNHFKIILI